MSCLVSQRLLRRQRKAICKTKRHCDRASRKRVNIEQNVPRSRWFSGVIVLHCALLPCALRMAIKLENKVTESCGISSINAENSVCHKVSILNFLFGKSGITLSIEWFYWSTRVTTRNFFESFENFAASNGKYSFALSARIKLGCGLTKSGWTLKASFRHLIKWKIGILIWHSILLWNNDRGTVNAQKPLSSTSCVWSPALW